MRTLTRLRAVGLVGLVAFVALVGPACEGSKGPAGPGETRTLTYAALGASDALGIGAIPPALGYVYDLRSRMIGAGFTVSLHNFGVLGAKADDIASLELPGAIAADPDVVTLWTGANDLVGGRSPDLFASQLDGILAAVRSRTGARVFVGDLPEITSAPTFAEDPDPDVSAARVRAFNERIRAVVAARGCDLVPLSTLQTDASMFSNDGFHPSNLGHRRIADTFWAQIQSRL